MHNETTLLTFEGLQDGILEVEVALNNRPLTYLEDHIQLPVLTPYSITLTRVFYLKLMPTTWKIEIFENERDSCGSVKRQCGEAGPKSMFEAYGNVIIKEPENRPPTQRSARSS